MEATTKPFNVKKTFGMDVLLKLTKTTINGIEAFERDRTYTFNVSVEELNKAVNFTLVNHNISLLVH